MPGIDVSKSDAGIALIRLNNPETHNVLGFELIEEFIEAVERLVTDDIRVLVITGRGKSFCGGADLKQIRTFEPEDASKFSRAGHQLFLSIARFPAPTIAAVNGYALGGGCELACSTDIILASTTARFGQPEARVGMITGWGGTFRLVRRIGHSRTKELFYTGRVIDVDEAYQLGIVDRVLRQENFDAAVDEYTRIVANMAPFALRFEKKLIDTEGNTLEQRIEAEAQALRDCVATDDQTEGIAAFVEKRSPRFRGA